MRAVLVASACALLLAGSTFGLTIAPTVAVSVDGSPIYSGTASCPDPQNPDVVTWQGSLSQGAYGLDVSVKMDSDPHIIYGISAQNFSGVTQTFTFVFTTPAVPMNYDNAFASISGSMTDGFPGNGVTVTPVAGKLQVATASSPLTNLSIDVGLGGTGGPGPALQSYVLPADSKSSTFAPTVFDTFTVTLSFKLTNGGDTATINGAASLVPEPATLALLGLGMCATLRRRSARS